MAEAGFSAHPSAVCESRTIGTGTRIAAFAHVAGSARIGRRCEVGEGAVVEEGARLGDNVRLGRMAQVGANAAIAPGVRIGYAAIVGAGSAVSADLPARAVAEGSPPRITGYAGAEELPEAAIDAGGADLPAGFPAKVLRLTAKSDHRGLLTVGSYPDGLPFRPRRWFTVSAVPIGSWRGAHAHRQCQQLMFVVSGRIHVALDDGESRFVVPLTSPALAIHTSPGVWNFCFGHTANATLIVLASDEYDSSDYISDYDDFLEHSKRRRTLPGSSES